MKPKFKRHREAQQFFLKQEEEASGPIYSLTPYSALAPEAFPLTQDHPEAQSKNHRRDHLHGPLEAAILWSEWQKNYLSFHWLAELRDPN